MVDILLGFASTILATPRSEILALMSAVNSTLLAERSRWMMGGPTYFSVK